MRIVRKLLEQVEKANQQYRLFQKNDSLVIALSGGPDSTALLFLLSKLQKKYGWKIVAAHLNHGLLHGQSRRHERAARKTAERLGLPFYAGKISLRRSAKRARRSLEETGRIERYRFFEEVCSKAQAKKIVTAHTLDDQAETVLLRILRGSGLRGLAGIARKRRQGKFEVVRPLLTCEKRDLVRMLKEERTPFCVDATNRSVFFTRNRVRLKLIPFLEKCFNPRAKQVLAGLQGIGEEAQDHLRKVSARAFGRCLKGRRGPGSNLVLDLSKIRRLHPAVMREVLCQAVRVKTGSLNGLDHDHISSIANLVRSAEDHLETHLPGSLIVKKDDGLLLFVKSRPSD